jgi:preprotein translocase subunit YajC
VGFIFDWITVTFDPTLLLMGAVLVVLIIFMVRNSRKRRRDAAEMQDKVKVGAEVEGDIAAVGGQVEAGVCRPVD